MIKNAAGRFIPESLPGLGILKPYVGPFDYVPEGRKVGPKIVVDKPRSDKILKSIDQAIEATGLKDGMTISFHHHFREGDGILNQVIEAIAKKGIKGLTLAPSSLNSINDAIIPFIESGVITAIETSGGRGALGKLMTAGDKLSKPVIIRSHGGRARAIEAGDLKIDVAFLGASICDSYGNMNGFEGPSACGSLGYAMVDAMHADQVVVVTDNLVLHPLKRASIKQMYVDYIVATDYIGNREKIVSGAVRITKDPRELLLAQYATSVIEHSGYFKDHFSMQLGTGGASLAAARFLGDKMRKAQISARFGLGGITAPFVEMLNEGLLDMIYDVQDFDLTGGESLRDNPDKHVEISASQYANPHSCGPIVNNLDVVILSATEVDVDFNVNVITNSNGLIMGASGGHCDTAAGSALSIVVAPLLRGRLPMVLDQVDTIITPGSTVDVIVTERGVAVNPLRQDLMDQLKDARVPVLNIQDLKKIAYDMAGEPAKIKKTDKVVAVVEYRDGTIIDTITRPE
jgi:citrate lyase subunit alpha/citrate CoA-transferase